MTPTYTPFEKEMLAMMKDLRNDMKTGFEQVDKRFEQVDKRFEQVDQRFASLESRMEHIEDAVSDLRDEVRAESATTRVLLNQAFEHISDQIASDDHQIKPSMVFRSRLPPFTRS